ncbi:ammonia-dependent NAD(+) synthetase [Priestia megaterium]|uniref:ammonia-dependent NAD(+) synthetase n=1 Tax=Priestia megaterium TaxID=1404 RepID=UPI0031018950
MTLTQQLKDEQQQIIKDLNVKATIDPTAEVRNRINFLKEYLLLSKAEGFVLGISGGQDSTLAGKLAQLAVEELRQEGHNAKFVTVRLPYQTQADEDDVQLALQFIKPDQSETFNISKTVDTFAMNYNVDVSEPLSDFHKGNVKARTRMMVQYAIGGMNNLLVIGTDHAAEAVTGFFTKYGDGGADILPLSGLTKRQGRSLLKELGAPSQLYLKEPTADLLDNKPQQTDETELGITYNVLDDFLEGKDIPSEAAEKIIARYKLTEHKRQLPASMYDSWWR